MKTLLNILFLCSLASCTKAQQGFFMVANNATQYTTADGKQPFVIIGNSIARGTESSNGKGPTPAAGTVYEWTGSALVEVAGNDLADAGTGSAWPQFGIDYYNATGKKAVFINTAVSGAEFYPNNDNSNWYTSGTLYAAMQTKVASGLSALGLTRPRGILIELGINDARGAQALTSIQTAVNSLVSRLNTDFPGVPVYWTNLGRSETAISDTRIDAVRGYITAAIAANSLTHQQAFDLRLYAQNNPTYYGSDNLHLNQTGNNFWGSELAAYVASH